MHLIVLINYLSQTGLTIIDSPGVGETDEMDEMVIQYLPKAFAFVYVINSANAGGIKKDRVSISSFSVDFTHTFLIEGW